MIFASFAIPEFHSLGYIDQQLVALESSLLVVRLFCDVSISCQTIVNVVVRWSQSFVFCGPQMLRGKHRPNRVCCLDMLPVRYREIVEHQHRVLVLHQVFIAFGYLVLKRFIQLSKVLQAPTRVSAIQISREPLETRTWHEPVIVIY